ncbi:BRISC complex subunit FAM175B-like [Tribolium madens]|uniref:BRISC complex subunit FAM175B-like n=1 Tax=Tribolium madens TaxID=41895 RepID=UPI001CF72413|nr:BRISC complex subunit FAM175B-like [Tribolium madens]
MTETLTVTFSGPAFSFLLRDNTKSEYCQVGFLLGEIIEKETKTITDNDLRQVHISREIRFNGSIPWPDPCYFHNQAGKVNAEKIKNFLGDLTPRVLAWYKYKHASGFDFTFRDRILHKQFITLFNVPPEFFTCCLLIKDSSENKSTHSWRQTFVRYCNYDLGHLRFRIENLSDPNNTYKSPRPLSHIVVKIINEVKSKGEDTQGNSMISRIQNAVQKHTSSLIDHLAEAEKRVFELEKEYKRLKAEKNRKLDADDKVKESNGCGNIDSEPTNTVNKTKEIQKSPIFGNAEQNATSSPSPKGARGRGGKRGTGSSQKGCHEMVTRHKKN